MGAHLTGLVRTRSGRFIIEQSVTLDKLADMENPSLREQALISTSEALADFPMVLVSDSRVSQGNARKPGPLSRIFCKQNERSRQTSRSRRQAAGPCAGRSRDAETGARFFLE